MLAGKILVRMDKNAYLAFCSMCNMMFFASLTSRTSYTITVGTWCMLIMISLLSIVGNYLSVYAIQLSDPVRAASVEITYPLWCMLFSLLLCGNVDLSTSNIVAMLLIVSGMAIFICSNNVH